MRIRSGFVTNSSSTCYIITNCTDERKTLLDFVKETQYLVDEFVETYDWREGSNDHYGHPFTREGMIQCVKSVPMYQNVTWEPGENKMIAFGDEDGTVVGCVYDYCLRYNGQSQSFRWRFYEYWR